MSREIQTVAVVGAPAVTALPVANLESSGARLVTLTEADVAGVAEADLVIVAGRETLAAQRELLAAVDAAAPAEAVVAVASAGFGLGELAFATANPTRVVGLRLPLRADLPGAELVTTIATDAEAVEAVRALLEKAGKTPTVIGDRPGQIVAGLLLPYLNQAAGMFEARYASRDDIDAAMRLGCGLPAGPLQLLDTIGVDVAYDLLDALHARTGDARHAPAPVLRQLIAAGRTGVAAGAGFYTYEAPGSAKAVADDDSDASGEHLATRPVQSVGVVGSGTMATGIMEVFAKAGYDVVYIARSDEKVAGVRAAIEKSLEKAVSRGKLAEADRDAALARLSGATSHDALAQVDLVVEAVVEDLAVKLELFKSLDKVCKPGAILATTTSSLPVVEMAAVTSRPADVIGIHFFNPAAVMKLVEVVETVQTAADVVATTLEVTKKVGKHAVQCGDRAGFIVNALLFPYLNDATLLLESGFADADTIDAAITGALGYPMGPFALIDVVGTDVTLAIQQVLQGAFREPGFTPAPLLGQLVGAGYLGRKTKRGFRAY
ncbi:3-hydroxyacyl-CoA dehydrogenase family protein [Spongisporangium articulatum]|uniref:3-hydroxyacyl-CoA dehydrogenase family protein n=1 Tax=Spongisporangium articulatum TaxID=3362603 RepID=A0ABW8ATB5_9ACTN